MIDYEAVDFTRESAVYDVVFDAAGKSSYDEARRVLAPDGVYVTTVPDPTLLLAEAATLFGDQKAEGLLVRRNADGLRAVAALIEQGEVRAVVDRTFPLDRAADAHRYVEGGHGPGKVVLTVD